MSLERRIAFEIYRRGASGAFHGANYAPRNSKITGLRTPTASCCRRQMRSSAGIWTRRWITATGCPEPR